MGISGDLISLLLQKKFPGLSLSGYKITSPESETYNCIAWAVYESDRWWWPLGKVFWPAGVSRDISLKTFIQAFATLGYVSCDNNHLEHEFEKIAIYVDHNGEPTHAARQLSNGKWTSKLGNFVDIEHELDGLTGSEYGTVAQILKRPIHP